MAYPKGLFTPDALTHFHPAYHRMTGRRWLSHPDWTSYDILSESNARGAAQSVPGCVQGKDSVYSMGEVENIWWHNFSSIFLNVLKQIECTLVASLLIPRVQNYD